jgi:hypothetical protein
MLLLEAMSVPSVASVLGVVLAPSVALLLGVVSTPSLVSVLVVVLLLREVWRSWWRQCAGLKGPCLVLVIE